MVPARFCLGFLISLYNSKLLLFCFVLLIGAAGCHIQMIRLQFRYLLSQKSTQSFLQLCDAMCIILYKQ